MPHNVKGPRGAESRGPSGAVLSSRPARQPQPCSRGAIFFALARALRDLPPEDHAGLVAGVAKVTSLDRQW